MAAERHVGKQTYELDFRGPRMRASGSSIVKSSCMDLIEKKPAAVYEECRDEALKVNQLLVDWQTKQNRV